MNQNYPFDDQSYVLQTKTYFQMARLWMKLRVTNKRLLKQAKNRYKNITKLLKINNKLLELFRISCKSLAAPISPIELFDVMQTEQQLKKETSKLLRHGKIIYNKIITQQSKHTKSSSKQSNNSDYLYVLNLGLSIYHNITSILTNFLGT